ncbi:hypothetical protein [Paracidovorax avenae]|uniref:hypothetical protein n=1 Tax=Paracidovorax avenae TaxID=80867 RepID=UPI001260348F|nr:hypothetical protein [Paracidovorax avenae]
MSTPDVPVLCQAGMAILALFVPLAVAWGIVRWSRPIRAVAASAHPDEGGVLLVQNAKAVS